MKVYLDDGAVEQPDPGRALDLGLSYQLPGPAPEKPAGPIHPLELSIPPTEICKCFNNEDIWILI